MTRTEWLNRPCRCHICEFFAKAGEVPVTRPVVDERLTCVGCGMPTLDGGGVCPMCEPRFMRSPVPHPEAGIDDPLPAPRDESSGAFSPPAPGDSLADRRAS